MRIAYTQEELDLLESIEKGEWKSLENVQGEEERYREYASGTLKKDKRLNIRISERDLRELQRKALQEGIPYQTLISSLLHKYVNGRLLDVNAITQLKERVRQD